MRMEWHCDTAMRIAEYLEGHDELELVKYQFLGSHPQSALAEKQMKLGGGLVTFVVKGGIERAGSFSTTFRCAHLRQILETPEL